MELATFLLMLGLSYALGVFWYDLLPARLPERLWRVAAYPFLGMFVAEAVFTKFTALDFDPQFGGVHLIATLVGSLVGVLVDWIITLARHPLLIAQPEPRAA